MFLKQENFEKFDSLLLENVYLLHNNILLAKLYNIVFCPHHLVFKSARCTLPTPAQNFLSYNVKSNTSIGIGQVRCASWLSSLVGGAKVTQVVASSCFRCHTASSDAQMVFLSLSLRTLRSWFYTCLCQDFFFFFTFLKLFLELLSPFLATRTFFSSLPSLLAVSSGRNGGCGNISMPPAQSLLCHPNWLLAKECLRPLRYHSVIFFFPGCRMCHMMLSLSLSLALSLSFSVCSCVRACVREKEREAKS